MPIESFAFNTDWRCFKKDEVISFRPGINILVGDQGCGKSSILQIFGMGNKAAKEIVGITGKCRTASLDFERNNPRVQGHIDHMIHALSRWKSHGETVLLLLQFLSEPKDEATTFLLDEPDMALSLRSVYRLANMFHTTVEVGHQIIAAVHHPTLIQSVPEVLSLEHRRWMAADEFIASQMIEKK